MLGPQYRRAARLLVIAGTLLLAAPAGAQEKVNKETIDRGRRMLEQLKKDLHQYYYDSTFGGRDMDAAFRRADSAVQQAKTSSEIMAHIADFMLTLDDSHTNFYPPQRAATVDYGFSMMYVGDTLFVVRVAPKSDAAEQGLKVGDAITVIDQIRPDRRTFHTIQYVYNALSPRPGMRLFVRSPDGIHREMIVRARIEPGERLIDYTDPSTITRLVDKYSGGAQFNHVWHSLGDSVLVWRMRSFLHEDDVALEEMAKRVKQHRAVVLDLRDNGGGSTRTQAMLISQFFDRDIDIATWVERGGRKPFVAKAKDKDPFRGMLVILVNSRSGSSSEMVARTMQLQARAILVGDRTAGAVMTSMMYPHEVGFGRRLSYASSITVTDVIMPDGARLEKTGVIPDYIVLPTGADLAAGRDPQMAKALELVGVSATPEQAARFTRPRAAR
jgi:C-terminal processing protease CtpA/Prc